MTTDFTLSVRGLLSFENVMSNALEILNRTMKSYFDHIRTAFDSLVVTALVINTNDRRDKAHNTQYNRSSHSWILTRLPSGLSVLQIILERTILSRPVDRRLQWSAYSVIVFDFYRNLLSEPFPF